MGVEGDAGEDRREGWGEEGRGAMRGQQITSQLNVLILSGKQII